MSRWMDSLVTWYVTPEGFRKLQPPFCFLKSVTYGVYQVTAPIGVAFGLQKPSEGAGMSDENKDYIRRFNAGALPWDVNPESGDQRPVFSASDEKNLNAPGDDLRLSIAASVLQALISREHSNSVLNHKALANEAVSIADILIATVSKQKAAVP